MPERCINSVSQKTNTSDRHLPLKRSQLNRDSVITLARRETHLINTRLLVSWDILELTKKEWRRRNLETGTTSLFAYQVWYDLKYRFIDKLSMAVFIASSHNFQLMGNGLVSVRALKFSTRTFVQSKDRCWKRDLIDTTLSQRNKHFFQISFWEGS